MDSNYLEKSIEDSFEIIQATSGYQTFVKEFSPIKKLFTGLEKTSTNCGICGNINNNFQTFSIWQLPIPVNSPTEELDLKDCMDKWFEKRN